MSRLKIYCTVLVAAIALFGFQLATTQATSESWTVIKMSGDVWINSEKPQKIALKQDQIFNLGEKITTGTNGRALLKRGNETILITPNSTIALPKEKSENGRTKIFQQMGRILLDVEKRNVKHFEISTPYLAAVVKGTQFKVNVDKTGSSVDVMRGKVEVKNYQTGQYVLVLPKQNAKVTVDTNQKHVLQVTGKGKIQKIQQGKPEKSLIPPVRTLIKNAPHLQKAEAEIDNHMRESGKSSLLSGNHKLAGKTDNLVDNITHGSFEGFFTLIIAMFLFLVVKLVPMFYRLHKRKK